MPERCRRRHEALRGSHEDEPHAPDAEPPREIPGDCDLEATSENDLAVTHDARLPYRVAEIEADHEHVRPRQNGLRRRDIVGPALVRKPERDERDRGDRNHPDQSGDDDADGPGRASHDRVERHTPPASSKTSTRVPDSAKPNSIGASY